MKRFLTILDNIFTPIVLVLLYSFMAFLVISILGLFIDFDLIRHNIFEKRHHISQEQIVQSLEFEYDHNKPEFKEVSEYISMLVYYLDDDVQVNKDSLNSDFKKHITFDSCMELYRDALNSYFPQSVSTFLLNESLELAKTKYETIIPILLTLRANGDSDKILATYNLVKSWKWDKDYIPWNYHYGHNYNLDYNNAIRICMELAIVTLEDSEQPVSDSTAATIIQLCNIGLDASAQLTDDGVLHPIAHFFSDKRAQYAYHLKDPKADKYADDYILRTRRSPLFSNHYHYLITDRGGDIEGYQNRFFTDPLFLRYKSCLKEKKYKKARDLLDILQSNTTDDYQDPINPFYFLHDSIQFSNRQVLDIALPYAQYDLATISENARLRFLTHKEDFGEWANGSFLTGAYYLSPTEGYSVNTVDCLFNENLIPVHELSSYMAINYNNQDARWVYNTALFMKGATTRIAQAIDDAIQMSNNSDLINGLKAIKREHVFSSELDTADEKYVALNDTVETLFGARMKETLSDCLYSFADIKNALSNNECAIEIVKAPSLSFGDDVYKAVILRSDWEEPRIVTLANSTDVNNYYLSGNYYNSASSKLYSAIWKPLEKYLSPKNIVYIAPDAVLSLVNFSAILNGKGQCLSDVYEIYQCVSTKSIKDRVHEEGFENIVMFGDMNYDVIADSYIPSERHETSVYRSLDNRPFKVFEPLSGTQKEVEGIKTIADRFGIVSSLFTGKEGTEYNFKDLTGNNNSIIHIATHGFYYSAESTKDLTYFEMISVDDNPYDRCGLLFSGGNIAWKGERIPDYLEDGILLGSEIARMDLSSTELVVLSACDTGLGEIDEEGIAGLQMAFKQAGVNSILMTLGKVDDEATAYFMTSFYERLFNGEDKHSSFKGAVDEMRNSERYSDPKYWSQFILID